MNAQHRGRFVAYYRVSTRWQGRSRLGGLEAQRTAVMDYLNGGSWELVGEFTEIESGKHSDRPELAKALTACRKQHAHLVIAKLDRLSRNLAFIANLMESAVEFVAIDNPTANKSTLHVLAAVAQHEREMISDRTKAALAAAKARGKKLGGPDPRGAVQRMAEARKARADEFARNVLPLNPRCASNGFHEECRDCCRAKRSQGADRVGQEVDSGPGRPRSDAGTAWLAEDPNAAGSTQTARSHYPTKGCGPISTRPNS